MTTAKAAERSETDVRNAHFAAIIESSQDAITSRDFEGRIASWNRGAEQLFGYTAKEALGQSMCQLLVPPERWAEDRQFVARVLASKRVEQIETVRRHKDGRMIDIAATLSPTRDASGHVIGLSKIAHDISDRKRMEEALHVSEAQFASAFEHAPLGIALVTTAGRFLKVNGALCEMLEYSAGELLAKSFQEITHSEDLGQDEEDVRQMLAGELATYQKEKRFLRKSGAIVWALLSVSLVRDVTGQPMHFISQIQNVTAHKSVADRMRRLFESNVQGVIFWNLDGTITEANDAFLRMLGYTRDELQGGLLSLPDITPVEYVVVDRHAAEQLADKQVCEPYEKEFIGRNGLNIPILLGAATFSDTPNEGVSFVLDLTERKKLELQIHRAQRMESIGTLAGGIAHDLNNALGPILMAIGTLKLTCPDPPSQEMLSIIEASAQHGADLVRQVLSFARGIEGRRMEVQVKHLIRDIERLVTETFSKSIQVEVHVPRDLWTVLGDATQLQQVLMNLCVNARDAMPHRGKLTISAENVRLDSHYAALNIEAHPGPYLFLQIEDTGTGISSGNLERIFEPFFTTKEFGEGTGLGLATSMAIVKGHGGFIRVYSEEGRGTKFKVYLPAQVEVSPEVLAAAEAALPRGHGELILVVDDELSVRLITQRTLIVFGYRVILASDGAEALAAYATHGPEIAVVLTDMMMPVMDGPATIQGLKIINPNVVIIAASGLSADERVAHAAFLGVDDFLAKPFTAGTLLQTLHQVLTSKS